MSPAVYRPTCSHQPWPASSNGFSVSAFAQNVGLVAVTGIKSRFVVACSGIILLLLGLFPVLGALVALVPLPVLGGAGLALFGTVAASGIRTLSEVEYEGNANLVIVAVALGMGVISIALPEFYWVSVALAPRNFGTEPGQETGVSVPKLPLPLWGGVGSCLPPVPSSSEQVLSARGLRAEHRRGVRPAA